MINPKLIAKFHESLANFVESGSDDILTWFIELDKEHKSNLLHSEVFLTKFWTAFARNGANITDIFKFLVDSSSKDTKNQVGKFFSTLFETKDHNKYSTLLTLFVENYSNWPLEIVTPIRNACLTIGLQIGHPHDVELLNTAFLTGELSDEQLQQISNLLIPRLSNPDSGVRDNALNLLGVVSQKSDKVQSIVFQDCVKHASELLAANNTNAKSLLDFLTSYPEKKLNLSKIDQIIGLIQDQLKPEKPQPIALLALEFVPKVIDNFNRGDILRTMLEFIQTVSDDVVKERCRVILVQYENRLGTTGLNKVKKVFGDDVFDKKSS